EATANSAFLQEAVVVAHEQVRFHLTHRVEHHTDQDQNVRPAEECGDRIRHAHETVEHDRNDSDHRQENSACQSNSAHGVVKIGAGGLAGAHAGDVAAMLLEVVSDL